MRFSSWKSINQSLNQRDWMGFSSESIHVAIFLMFHAVKPQFQAYFYIYLYFSFAWGEYLFRGSASVCQHRVFPPIPWSKMYLKFYLLLSHPSSSYENSLICCPPSSAGLFETLPGRIQCEMLLKATEQCFDTLERAEMLLLLLRRFPETVVQHGVSGRRWFPVLVGLFLKILWSTARCASMYFVADKVEWSLKVTKPWHKE